MSKGHCRTGPASLPDVRKNCLGGDHTYTISKLNVCSARRVTRSKPGSVSTKPSNPMLSKRISA